MIVPQLAIAEIIDMTVTQDFENSPCVIGTTHWRNASLIVCSSTALLTGSKPIKPSAQKILVMHKLYTKETPKFYGIAIDNAPKMQRFSADAFSEDNQDTRDGILCQTQVEGETAFILDLNFIENAITALVADDSNANTT